MKAYISKPKPCNIPPYKWVVYYRFPNSPKKRKPFKTRLKADTFYNKTKEDIQLAAFTGIPENELDSRHYNKVVSKKVTEKLGIGIDDLVREYEKLRDIIGPKEIPLASAAKIYCTYVDPCDANITLGEAVKAFLEDMKSERKSTLHLNNLKSCLKKLTNIFEPETKLKDISAAPIKKWLEEYVFLDRRSKTLKQLDLTSKLNYQAHWGVFLNYYVKFVKVLESNPITRESLNLPADNYSPKAYGVCDTRKIMMNLTPDNLLFLYLPIAFFAGLRISEMHRIRWRNIRLETREIILPGDITKTHLRRIVYIQDNLAEWIRVWTRGKTFDPDELVFGDVESKLRKDIPIYIRSLGVNTIRNGIRHSGASYLLALTRDVEYTSKQMGHSVDILNQNYNGLVLQEDAIEYFNIFPPQMTPNLSLHSSEVKELGKSDFSIEDSFAGLKRAL